MATIDIINRNKEAFDEMTKEGIISTKYIHYLRIYELFNSLPYSMPTMDKYAKVSAELNTPEETVRKIIKYMNS